MPFIQVSQGRREAFACIKKWIDKKPGTKTPIKQDLCVVVKNKFRLHSIGV